MFDGSTSLKTLDISSFDTSNVNQMEWIFYAVNKLERIKLGSKTNLSKAGGESHLNVTKSPASTYTGNWVLSNDETSTYSDELLPLCRI